MNAFNSKEVPYNLILWLSDGAGQPNRLGPEWSGQHVCTSFFQSLFVLAGSRSQLIPNAKSLPGELNGLYSKEVSSNTSDLILMCLSFSALLGLPGRQVPPCRQGRCSHWSRAWHRLLPSSMTRPSPHLPAPHSFSSRWYNDASLYHMGCTYVYYALYLIMYYCYVRTVPYTCIAIQFCHCY